MNVLLALTACAAHFPRVEEPTLDLEPITIGVPFARNQLFEAQLPLHFFLHDGLEHPRLMNDGGFGVAPAFSFIATLRMETSQSTPIRPPSYLPRLRLQLVDVLPLAWRSASHADRLLVSLGVMAAHHSNGQKGCALRDGALLPGATSDFDCGWPPGVPRSGELNLDSGSFTEHLLGAELLLRWLSFPVDGGASRGGATGKHGVDWNVPCTFSGCIEPAMRRRYGESAIRWLASGELLAAGHHRAIPFRAREASDARLRLTASGAVHLGLGQGHSPYGDAPFDLAYLTRFEHGGSGGPFVRYHHGRDPLNIRFEERWDVWLVGYLVELTGPPMLEGPGH
ncbi:hypothetical protein [Anaeromyxobacter dehalogenans]|uniref:hypothetical protein n=1 Tax=Anaeromyxobacter dehalogenans TaxID=161493 RepID=UPI0002F5CD8A|nr:hypothetical protein [Anaeromyxobacter dehalogenans]